MTYSCAADAMQHQTNAVDEVCVPRPAHEGYIHARRQIWASLVSPAAKIIALAIVEHMMVGKLAADPSKARLMQMTGLPASTFERHYKVAKGLFTTTDRPGRRTVFEAKALDVAKEIAALWPSPVADPGSKRPSPNMTYTPPLTMGEGVRATPPQTQPSPPPTMGDRRVVEEKITTREVRVRTREDLDQLECDLFNACNGAAANPAVAPGLLKLSDPIRWIEQGCDLEMDILPAIRARAAKMPKGSIKSWGYFTDAVVQAKANRLAPLPEASPVVSSIPPWKVEVQERNRKTNEALARLAAKWKAEEELVNV